VATISYDIASVSVVNKNAVIKFRILKDGTPVTLNVPTLVRNAATGAMVVNPAYEPISGFALSASGGVTLYVAFAAPQDGIAAPADFNKTYSTSLANVLIASGSPKAGTTTGPDASGYYTATLTGDLVGQPLDAGCVAATPPAVTACNSAAILASPYVIPTNAVMVTGMILGTFTQKVADGVTTYVPANVSVNNVAVAVSGTTPGVAKGTVAAYGGVTIRSMLKKLVATGYTARRVSTDVSKCNACHEQLGAVPDAPTINTTTLKPGAVGVGGFHNGARNDSTACPICHTPNGVKAGWTYNASTFVHAIHGKDKRANAYNWNAAGTAGATFAANTYTTLYSFKFPGVLQDCNSCHVPNAVNFGASGATLLPNLLWSTTATGATNAGVGTAPWITAGYNYGNGFTYTAEGATVSTYTPSNGAGGAGTAVAAYVAGAGGVTVPAQSTTLVHSPISAACFSCHDTTMAKAHMTGYGGVIYGARGTLTATSNVETCLVCHGAGKVNDAAIIHHK